MAIDAKYEGLQWLGGKRCLEGTASEIDGRLPMSTLLLLSTKELSCRHRNSMAQISGLGKIVGGIFQTAFDIDIGFMKKSLMRLWNARSVFSFRGLISIAKMLVMRLQKHLMTLF